MFFLNLSISFLCVILGSAGLALDKRQTQTSTSTSSAPFSAPTIGNTITANNGEFDLSQHYCRLWRHASALNIVDGKIYVDGGNSTNQWDAGIATFLLEIDLSSNFTNQDKFPYTSIPKSPAVPSGLIEHVLCVTAPNYVPLDQIPPPSIWQLDIDSGNWSETDFDVNNAGSSILHRPGAAANCDAPSLNMSFLFEGYLQQRSEKDTANFTQSSEFQFLEGMLSLDTTGLTPSSDSFQAKLTNITVPNYIGPPMNGAMVHVPVGEKGVVVQIGGQTDADPQTFGVGIANANTAGSNLNISFVDIYDIETGYWFRQDTFGVPELPSGRSDICTVLVAAEDGSSYNTLVIEGVSTYNGVVTNSDYEETKHPAYFSHELPSSGLEMTTGFNDITQKPIEMDAHMPSKLPDRRYLSDEGNTFNIMSEEGNLTSSTMTDLTGVGGDTQHNSTIEEANGHN